VLALFATLSGARWPRARDIGLTIAGVALMTLALLPLRAMPPGVLTLLAQCLGGGLIFGTVVAVFDIAGLRRIGLETLHKLRRRGI
jgi:hypothetical protein